jgi:uncharacterized membrane protein YidH (DUF202 family)
MDRPAGTGQKAGLSDYLAVERTLLAWIRTGLALMGFGFVVARFGLFLQEFQVAQHTQSGAVIRFLPVVRHRTHRRWSNRKYLCRMAPRQIGRGIGSR